MPEYETIGEVKNAKDRVIPDDEITIKERGFFQGYAVCNLGTGNRYQYRYNKYGSFEDAAQSMIDMLRISRLDPEQLVEVIEKLPLAVMEWDENKDEREMFELSDGTLVWMSNHIPDNFEGATFVMVGDHSNCVGGYCVNPGD